MNTTCTIKTHTDTDTFDQPHSPSPPTWDASSGDTGRSMGARTGSGQMHLARHKPTLQQWRQQEIHRGRDGKGQSRQERQKSEGNRSCGQISADDVNTLRPQTFLSSSPRTNSEAFYRGIRAVEKERRVPPQAPSWCLSGCSPLRSAVGIYPSIALAQWDCAPLLHT